MKKSFLAVLLALMLCFSLSMAVACNPNQPTPTPPTPSAEVPTQEGKVTYYFELAEDSVEQGTYASYWIVGDFSDWKEKPNDGALEATNVEGTRLYYVFGDAPTKGDDGEYKLGFKVTLGYNESSTLPADKQGVNWSYQSKECPAGMDNQTMVYNEGDTTVNLGTQTFETAMPAPQRMDTTLVVQFKTALPEGAKVAIPGDFNGWDSAKAFATVADDRMSASLELTDVLVMTYYYKIKVFANYEEGKFWSDENNIPYGVEIAGYQGANLSLELKIAYKDDECILNNTFPIIGYQIDISEADESNKIAIAYQVSTLKVTFAAPVERPYVLIKGSFDGWAGFHEMTANDAKTEYTYEVAVSAGEYEYIICLCDTADNSGNQYDQKVAGTGEQGAEANAKVTIVKGTTSYDLFATVVVITATTAE